MTRLILSRVVVPVLLVAAPFAGALAADPAASSQTAAFEPAPMPDHDLFAPVQRASEDPHVTPNVFMPGGPTQFRGDGYSPGSTAQSYETRHVLPGAGLNLEVPLK